jgi:lipoprotein-releasing system permease protein
MDSIAILKATGFSGNDVKWIFIAIDYIGLTGGVFWISFHYVFFYYRCDPFETTSLPTVKTYPIDYNIVYYSIG